MWRASSIQRACVVIFVLTVGVMVSDGRAEERLSGWAAYKFGMSQAQVSAVRGIKWSKDRDQFRSTSPVRVDGLDYDVSLSFSADGLSRISFKQAASQHTADDCRGLFIRALAGLERRHGLFRPRLPSPRGKVGDSEVRWWRSGGSTYTERITIISPLHQAWPRKLDVISSRSAERLFGGHLAIQLTAHHWSTSPASDLHDDKRAALKRAAAKRGRCDVRISYGRTRYDLPDAAVAKGLPWGPYRTGMTMAEVQAVPGMRWSNSARRSAASLSPALIGAVPYSASLVLDEKNDVVRAINLEYRADRMMMVDVCRFRFLDTLADLEQRHGAFHAAAPPNALSNISRWGTVRSNYFEWTTDDVTQGDSRVRTTVDLARHVGGEEIDVELRHTVRYRESLIPEMKASVGKGPGECIVRVRYGPSSFERHNRATR